MGSGDSAVFTVGLGVAPDVMEQALEFVAEGAREAGRDPASIEPWFLAQANVADDADEAIDGITQALAASAHHSLQFILLAVSS